MSIEVSPRVKKLMSSMAFALFVGVLVLPAIGCVEDDGPMEEVGEEIDEAAEDIKDAVD
jgi:outer membrane lipoprotein-sorting protein